MASRFAGHPGGRDCSAAVTTAADFARFARAAAAAGYHVDAVPLAPGRADDAVDLVFHGHFLHAGAPLRPAAPPDGEDDVAGGADGTAAAAADTTDAAVLRPRAIPGRVFARTPQQVFARTATVLEMGMCGGPVVGAAAALPGAAACYGIVEGIVPPVNGAAMAGMSPAQAEVRQQLSGAAVFVECDDLRGFLEGLDWAAKPAQ